MEQVGVLLPLNLTKALKCKNGRGGANPKKKKKLFEYVPRPNSVKVLKFFRFMSELLHFSKVQIVRAVNRSTNCIFHLEVSHQKSPRVWKVCTIHNGGTLGTINGYPVIFPSLLHVLAASVQNHFQLTCTLFSFFLARKQVGFRSVPTTRRNESCRKYLVLSKVPWDTQCKM